MSRSLYKMKNLEFQLAPGLHLFDKCLFLPFCLSFFNIATNSRFFILYRDLDMYERAVMGLHLAEKHQVVAKSLQEARWWR